MIILSCYGKSGRDVRQRGKQLVSINICLCCAVCYANDVGRVFYRSLVNANRRRSVVFLSTFVPTDLLVCQQTNVLLRPVANSACAFWHRHKIAAR